MDLIENDTSNNSSLACAFIAVVTFLPSRCLATIRGYTYGAHKEGFMKHTVEMGSGAMIRPSFIKFG
jgi:hypothetical protein